MKKQLLFLFVILLLPVVASADVVVIDGIYYNLITEENVAEVAREPYTNYYTGSIVIPEKVTYDGTEYSVTSIGEAAFFASRYITSVTIPNSVTSIGSAAFAECIGLTSMTIPNSVTSIDNYAFAQCTGLTSMIIPNSVTSIGQGTFSCCTGLTSVTISNSMKSIGQYAFGYCYSLTSVTIPNSVTIIDDGVFRGCSGLLSVTISNSVTSIGNLAFEGCSSLTSVIIPNDVTTIKDSAFKNCSSLTSVTMGTEIRNIYGQAFVNCKMLENVYCYSKFVPQNSQNAFELSPIESATLHVPDEAINDYCQAKPWKDFKSIVALTDDNPKPAGVNAVTSNGKATEGKIYRLDGQCVKQHRKGLYIVNGRKVTIK